MPVLLRSRLRSAPLLALVLAAGAALSGCGSLDGASNRLSGLVTPYKPEVVQGNFVSKEQVEALQPGMSRLQVRDVLGTPLLASLFHADRWDYVFTLRRQGVAPQSYKLVLFFKGDELERFEGDTMPSETEFVARVDTGRKPGKVPVLEASEEALAKFPPARDTGKDAPAAEAPLPASYPPLEPSAR
ncbi:outer membrane protein assembly factor BamE [Ramlibacter sp. 2FC]|uniref:outer membrane protein assembly factor BamE n=1 Tax=Ramlibacter sp. 2FC TaxID=2502188 RepID=UPI0010F73A1D|nr:outer membrane protein assembly factor BamE [Ramlibacter sp. 2FC]